MPIKSLEKMDKSTNDYFELILKELERLNENQDEVKTILDVRFSELNKKILEQMKK